jgi:hypothetical protein
MFLRSVLILLFVVNGAAFGQTTQTKLEFGNAIERNLGGSDVNSYQLDLAPNQYAEVVQRVRATAVLMARFYEALLSRGLSPAAALRTAQVSMSQDKRWHHPRYWAGFTIQGEWK